MNDGILRDANQASGRTVIHTRIASDHPLSAYGGIQLSGRVLEQIAEAVRSETIPMVINHDHARPLNARCLRVEIVEQPDGYKAVEAIHEVDSEAWDSFQNELGALGTPGGMSFTGSVPIADLASSDASETTQFKLAADAHHFTDEAIEESASVLANAGAVRAERLYQFNAVPSCRIVIEYVQQSGGLEGVARDIIIGVTASTIYDALKKLLKRRSTTPTSTEPPPTIEIHTVTEFGGTSRQRLLLRTGDDEVIKRALDNFDKGMGKPNPLLEWDKDLDDWVEP
jgi:hypothetical protein